MTRYGLDDFKRAGWYKPKHVSPVEPGELNGGAVVELAGDLRRRLDTKGGNDKSKVDFGVITELLSRGLPPEDVYATFAASARGKDAALRKAGHFDDYLRRTISAALSKATLSRSRKRRVVPVDFSKSDEGRYVHPSGIVSYKAHEVLTQEVRWLWPPYIPYGKLTILAGDPGLGKSTISIDLVSRISNRWPMPETKSNCRAFGKCGILSSEDGRKDTIVPRLAKARANLKRVEILARSVMEDDSEVPLIIPRHVEMLRNYVENLNLRLLIIDPLDAFLEDGVNTYSNHEMRRALAPLDAIAEETGVSVLIIAHYNKKAETSHIYRVGGSIGFVAAARSVLGVAPVTGDEDGTNVFYSIKGNLAKKPPALLYRMTGDDDVSSSRVQWDGISHYDPTRSAPGAPQKRKEWLAFFKQVLAEGEVESNYVWEQAKAIGLKERKGKEYRQEFGIQSRKGVRTVTDEHGRRSEPCWFFVPPTKWPDDE